MAVPKWFQRIDYHLWRMIGQSGGCDKHGIRYQADFPWGSGGSGSGHDEPINRKETR
jgi:hypothetical protein